jgi:prepilin-type N-terminal cleavage/methylation domain-containing protein
MRRSGGFTLIEVMVALTVGAIVVLLAHRLFAGVTDGARRMGAARAALDQEVNARRWLVEAFGSLDVGNGAGFDGHADRVQFATWQQSPEGWLLRQPVDLAVRGHRLVAQIGPGQSLVLADSVSRVQLDYLLEVGSEADGPGTMPGERASFVREWISPVSAPLAVRLRLTRMAGTADTLLLIIGPRG